VLCLLLGRSLGNEDSSRDEEFCGKIIAKIFLSNKIIIAKYKSSSNKHFYAIKRS